MADETASTATSTDQTTAAATDQASTDAGTPATTGKAADASATTETKTDDLGTTALGNDTATEKTDGTTEGAKAEVPETYELTAPEGFEKLDEETVNNATPIFKELGLSNEQANKLMPLAGQIAKRVVEQRDQQFLGTILEQRKNWLEEAKADKEIGGANWDGTLQSAARALDNLGFPKGSALRSALDESGFGNHPEMIRLMAKVGKAIGEDSDFVRSDAGAAVKPKTAEETLWPGQGQKA